MIRSTSSAGIDPFRSRLIDEIVLCNAVDRFGQRAFEIKDEIHLLGRDSPVPPLDTFFLTE